MKSSSLFGRELRRGEIRSARNVSNEEGGTEGQAMCVCLKEQEEEQQVPGPAQCASLLSPSFSQVSSTGHHLSTGLSRGSTQLAGKSPTRPAISPFHQEASSLLKTTRRSPFWKDSSSSCCPMKGNRARTCSPRVLEPNAAGTGEFRLLFVPLPPRTFT